MQRRADFLAVLFSAMRGKLHPGGFVPRAHMFTRSHGQFGQEGCHCQRALSLLLPPSQGATSPQSMASLADATRRDGSDARHGTAHTGVFDGKARGTRLPAAMDSEWPLRTTGTE